MATSKDILLRLCKQANAQCKEKNVDVDFIGSLMLHYYSSGEWRIQIGTRYRYDGFARDASHEVIGIHISEAPWQPIAYDRRIHRMSLFKHNDGIELDEDDYYAVLNAMMKNGCMMVMESKDAVDLEVELDANIRNVKDEIKKLIANKHFNKNYLVEAQRLMDKLSKLNNEYHEKANPTITIVPYKFENVEALQVWLDVNDA